MKHISRTGPITATIAAPPSKSYSVRALLLAAMTNGTTTITNCLDADDTRYAWEALRAIGYDIGGSFQRELYVGERLSMSANEVAISAGNAGTVMRFLTGWLAFTPGRFIISGDQRMHERPIGDLVEVLMKIDAEVEYVEREGYPPLRIRGKRMRGGNEVSIAADVSSQFVSALMLGAATLPGGMTIHLLSSASAPYIEITADILRAFGATVQRSGNSIEVKARALERNEYRVEGDYSSASYWFAAAAVTGGTVRVTGLASPSVQGDARFLDILEAMGCSVARSADHIEVHGAGLTGGTFDCNATPDIVPTLAAIAPLASSPVEITNVANLRVKESDRLAVLTAELRRLGASVDEKPDGLVIRPGWGTDAATIDPHGDHRIAMSFAISGLARGDVTIGDERVASKSYPRFWKTLDEVTAGAG